MYKMYKINDMRSCLQVNIKMYYSAGVVLNIRFVTVVCEPTRTDLGYQSSNIAKKKKKRYFYRRLITNTVLLQHVLIFSVHRKPVDP